MILMAPNGTRFARAISGPRSVQGPLPPTAPRNPFAPMKSIIHGAIRISGQKVVLCNRGHKVNPVTILFCCVGVGM